MALEKFHLTTEDGHKLEAKKFENLPLGAKRSLISLVKDTRKIEENKDNDEIVIELLADLYDKMIDVFTKIFGEKSVEYMLENLTEEQWMAIFSEYTADAGEALGEQKAS